jgi:hypothetical protein
LAGQQNGKLPDSVLVTIHPLPGVGGADVRLIQPAARGYCALRGTGYALGHRLKPTSAFDSYRTYPQQVSTFTSRYTRTYLPGRPYRIWNGVKWYQKPGTAVAAVPGTSNHGWAAAVDNGEERDSDSAAESLDNPTLNWLLANEERFGFFHSVRSEPWHNDWFPGDVIPAAVLEWERVHGMYGLGNVETGDDDVAQPNTFQLTAAVHGADEDGYWISFGGTRERILNNQDYQDARLAYPNLIPLPSAVPAGGSKGWPSGPLNSWSVDKVNRLLGRRTDGK